jgi:hypothetical protein
LHPRAGPGKAQKRAINATLSYVLYVLKTQPDARETSLALHLITDDTAYGSTTHRPDSATAGKNSSGDSSDCRAYGCVFLLGGHVGAGGQAKEEYQKCCQPFRADHGTFLYEWTGFLKKI